MRSILATARKMLVGLPLVLCACTNPFGDAAPTIDEVLAGGWLTEEGPPKPLTPLYCYGTIGSGDCHAAPLTDGGGRLVGFQGPPPPVSIER